MYLSLNTMNNKSTSSLQRKKYLLRNGFNNNNLPFINKSSINKKQTKSDLIQFPIKKSSMHLYEYQFNNVRYNLSPIHGLSSCYNKKQHHNRNQFLQINSPKKFYENSQHDSSSELNKNKCQFKKIKLPKQLIDNMFNSNKQPDIQEGKEYKLKQIRLGKCLEKNLRDVKSNDNIFETNTKQEVKPKRKSSQTINILIKNFQSDLSPSPPKNEKDNNDSMFLTKMTVGLGNGFKTKGKKTPISMVHLNKNENSNIKFLLDLMKQTKKQIDHEQNDLQDILKSTQDAHSQLSSLTQYNFAKTLQKNKWKLYNKLN